MRIKLGIVEPDEIYLSRLVSTLNQYYSDKLEIYSYTSIEYAKDALGKQRHDMILANENLPADELKNCYVAYFVESADIEQLNGKKAICKFQKAELIYKDILSLYAEYSSKSTKKKQNTENAKVITFMSPVNGSGNTSVAAAFALNCALNRKSVLFLNLETIPSTDIFFGGTGKYTFTDVIYSVKSRKANLSMKLESFVVTDPAEVDFYEVPKNPMDIHELNEEDIELLVNELKTIGLYDYIVVDINFVINRNTKKIIDLSDSLVFVSGSDERSLAKMEKANTLIRIFMGDETIVERAYMVINNLKPNYDNSTMSNYNVVAAFDYMNGLSFRQVIEQMANNQLFTNLY